MNKNEELNLSEPVKAKAISSSEFDRLVVKSPVPVLVDWWAPWCGPCRMLAPTMDKLAKEFADKAVIFKINCEEDVDMSLKMGIKALPTVALWNKGKEVARITGLRSIEDYRNALNSALDNK